MVLPAAGALWFTMNAHDGSGNAGSRLERLALAALFGMMALTVWRMIFRDLRRLTAELRNRWYFDPSEGAHRNPLRFDPSSTGPRRITRRYARRS